MPTWLSSLFREARSLEQAYEGLGDFIGQAGERLVPGSISEPGARIDETGANAQPPRAGLDEQRRYPRRSSRPAHQHDRPDAGPILLGNPARVALRFRRSQEFHHHVGRAALARPLRRRIAGCKFRLALHHPAEISRAGAAQTNLAHAVARGEQPPDLPHRVHQLEAVSVYYISVP